MGVVHWSPLCTTIGVLHLIVFLLVNKVFPPNVWYQYAYHAGSPEWYQFITSLFIHKNWAHLTSNAFVLFAFGAYLEQKVSSLHFCIIYLLSGIGGCLLFSLLHDSSDVAIGASGAIFGIICSMVFMDPKSFVIMPGAPLPLPILLFAIFYVGKEFVGLGIEDQVAHSAHIGGGFAGALVGRFISKRKTAPVTP